MKEFIYDYYPGCSLKSTGRNYEESLLAVCENLGIKLNEIDDWNCCGATTYMSVDEASALALAARNFALVKSESSTIIAPCSACLLVLNKVKDTISKNQEMREKITDKFKEHHLSLKAEKIKIRHPLDIFVNEYGIEEIKKKIKFSLEGINVIPYYGCQIVRPYAFFDDQYSPMTMDNLFSAMGAKIPHYPLKTRCCGGTLQGTIPEVGTRLNYLILSEAVKRGGDVIVTTCPLCQFNLECYQNEISKKYDKDVHIPVIYFTQLMGLALGISEKELGMNRILTPHKNLLEKIRSKAVAHA